ncbi:hypothetical protein Fmac_014826 [Flemingia macrophylla]|uniref:Uncharacterized protein n=1 Tax=Flemingia macrophylla TaxID=520843 RepID=A0ABD1MCV0_9FABA
MKKVKNLVEECFKVHIQCWNCFHMDGKANYREELQVLNEAIYCTGIRCMQILEMMNEIRIRHLCHLISLVPAAALVDIWEELRGEDDGSAMEKICELVNRNMADIVVTRNVASGTVDYKYHYATQHYLLRDLAIFQTSQEPTEKRNRQITDISGEVHKMKRNGMSLGRGRGLGPEQGGATIVEGIKEV